DKGMETVAETVYVAFAHGREAAASLFSIYFFSPSFSHEKNPSQEISTYRIAAYTPDKGSFVESIPEADMMSSTCFTHLKKRMTNG
ncbi:hypothetical protein STEG23_012951, partial [Scotinomys teguina]